MSETLTREKIVEVIAKSKAKTITEIWRGLGHKSAIGGGTAKKIRSLVPEHLQMLDANRNGTIVKAEKTPTVKAEVTSVKVAVTPETVPAKKKGAYVKKQKGAGGFRKGSCLEILFIEGSKDFIAKDELFARVAAIMDKSVEKVAKAFDVTMPYPHVKNNAGRADLVAESDKKGSRIKIIVPA